MKRTDLLLKIIAAAEGAKVTPVQLQKVAFYVAMEFPTRLPKDYYIFRKYDYGPFSAKVYTDAEKLEQCGYISISLNQGGGWREYAATVQGMKVDLTGIPSDVSEFIVDKVHWAQGLTFQQLVRAVYMEYPEFREKSVFQG